MNVEMFAVVAGAITVGSLLTPLLSFVTGALTEAAHFLVGLVVVRYELAEEAGQCLSHYLDKHGKTLVAGEERFVKQTNTLKRTSETINVFWRVRVFSNRLIRYKKAFIWLSPGAVEQRGGGPTDQPVTFSFIRGTLDWNELLLAASLAADAAEKERVSRRRRNRFRQFFGSLGDKGAETLESWNGYHYDTKSQVPVGWDVSELGWPDETPPGLSKLAFSPATQDLIDDLRVWTVSESWYAERGIPWRRGYLLHGRPGTGKTSLIRGLAEELDLPVLSIDLASCTNKDLCKAWANDVVSRSIVLLEDIDSVFHARENVTKGGELSFDTLLNCLDGLVKKTGVVVFITTNHLEYIDSALGVPGPDGASRPGRIDKIVELPDLNLDGRLKIALRILKDEELAVSLAQKHQNVTGAQFQEICCQAALQIRWNKKTKSDILAAA